MTTTTLPIDTEDVLDTQDLQERIKELENCGYTEDEREELAMLLRCKTEVEDCTGESFRSFRSGISMIRDSYFEEYARELAADSLLNFNDSVWPYTCIDWSKAVSKLQREYSMVTYDGVDYWIQV